MVCFCLTCLVTLSTTPGIKLTSSSSRVLQGCCISRPLGPNSPYPGAAQSSSARAINSPAEAGHTAGNPSATDRQQQQDASPGARRHRRPLDQRINKPLRRHEWASTNKSWSRATLDRERDEFFDTRVSGRPEVWQTLKAALEVLWDSDNARPSLAAAVPEDGAKDAEQHDPAVALATAQSILTAADILLPTGDLANGVYDSLGNYYQLPPQIVCDPVNIVADQDILSDSKNGLEASGEGPSGDADDDLDDADRRREEKGKAVVDARSQMLVAIRLSETSKDLKLRVGKNETVRSIARRIIEETGVSSVHTLTTCDEPRLQTRGNKIRTDVLGNSTAQITASGWFTSANFCKRTPPSRTKAGKQAKSSAPSCLILLVRFQRIIHQARHHPRRPPAQQRLRRHPHEKAMLLPSSPTAPSLFAPRRRP